MTVQQSRWKTAGAWMRCDDDPSRLPWRIFWVGFAVRVLYMTLAHGYRIRVIDDHFDFGWEMGRIARALATGYGYADPFNGHSGPTAWNPPLFPLILAGVFKVFGVYTPQSAWVILALNCVFSAAVAPAVYEVAWRCFGRAREGMKIALWSGWLWALYPAAMQFAVRWVWEMSLTAMLFTWAIVLALRIRGVGEQVGTSRAHATRRWVIFGTLWGLIALTNSSLLTFLPACGLWMIWPDVRVRARIGATLRRAALAAVCCLAVLSPWVVRNWLVFHAFVPMRANFGAELFESVLLARGAYPWGTTISLAVRNPEYQLYRQMGEVAYSKRQQARAVAIFRAHPREELRIVGTRFYFFWAGVPHPIEQGFAVELAREANYGFLSLCGLLGLALALRRRVPGAWLFLWAFALPPALYYVLTVQARFRHPLEPLICILGVYLFRSADRTRLFSWQERLREPVEEYPG